MTPVHVLLVFQSRTGRTESLILAAAVGAVQGRADIRLRRLPSVGEESGEHNETLDRMLREYVPPTLADTRWADAVIIGANGKIAGLTVELEAAKAYGKQAAATTRACLDSGGATFHPM